jgi:hypothetical protein
MILISGGGMFLFYRVLKAQSDHRSRHEGKGSTKFIFIMVVIIDIVIYL